MKVLITGGCGFLGSNLACFYLDQNASVYIIDNLSRNLSEKNLNWLVNHPKKDNLFFKQENIQNKEKINSFFKTHGPFDFICHVAGQVAMTTSLNDPREDLYTNLLGTFNILEATRSMSKDSLLAFSSTNKVYGDLESIDLDEKEFRYQPKSDLYKNGFDENLPLDFSTPYGCSKGSADQYVRDWSRIYGLKTVVFRHSSIYGGRQYSTKDQGWIGWFTSEIIKQKTNYKNSDTFTISGTGKQVRDVLYSEDLVDLYHSAYLNKESVAGEIFNIGGGVENSLSILELIEYLKDVLKIDKLNYQKIDRRQSDQDYFVADVSKIYKKIGWKPKYTFKKGLNKMIKWTEEINNSVINQAL